MFHFPFVGDVSSLPLFRGGGIFVFLVPGDETKNEKKTLHAYPDIARFYEYYLELWKRCETKKRVTADTRKRGEPPPQLS